MDDALKRDFEVLKKEHENLKKSHHELVKIMMKLSDGLRSFVETERGAQRYGKEIVSARLKGHYEIFNDAYLKISELKYGN